MGCLVVSRDGFSGMQRQSPSTISGVPKVVDIHLGVLSQIMTRRAFPRAARSSRIQDKVDGTMSLS